MIASGSRFDAIVEPRRAQRFVGLLLAPFPIPATRTRWPPARRRPQSTDHFRSTSSPDSAHVFFDDAGNEVPGQFPPQQQLPETRPMGTSEVSE